MKAFPSRNYLLGSVLCFSLQQAVESYDLSRDDTYHIDGKYKAQAPDLTREQNYTLTEYDPLKPLGIQDTYKLKSSWALTVNDQCLYEFVYQFEHPKDFPIGDNEHDGTCDFGTLDDPVKPKIAPEDNMPYLKPRRYWERFPDYVWKTIGFNHLSMDWQACGRKPAGFRQPQYDVSFFRVTPEYRVNNMVCKVYDDKWMTIVPFEDYCDPVQDMSDPNAINFHIIPTAMKDETPVVNMPKRFTQRKVTYAAQPYYGMRAWDEARIPQEPDDWKYLEVFTASHAGNTVLWQTHIPYKFISGEDRQFHSLAHRYWETTIQTMPDTWAVKYDERDGKIYFTMVGKSELCREDFEKAQAAAGGPPQFPDYPDDDEFTDAPTSVPGEDRKNGKPNYPEKDIQMAKISSAVSPSTILSLFAMMAVAWLQ